MQNFMLSCDWGTSSFRLRLVNLDNHQVVGEVLSMEGIARTYARWKEYSTRQVINRDDFYLLELRKHMDILSDSTPISLKEIPVVISGMASSSIGIRELDYAPVPFSMDGSDAVVQWLDANYNFPCRVLLVSGVSNRQDVMRGEETQLAGLAMVDSGVYTKGDAVCIFPGTHSKHVMVREGEMFGFKTYMTGELFQVLTQHSILQEAIIAQGNGQALSKADVNAFCRGIRQAETKDLLHTLFSVRINQLFDFSTKEENYFYLSGLLIGTELSNLMHQEKRQIILCSGSSVYPLYRLAMEELALLPQTVFIAPDVMDKSVIEGQINIFRSHVD